MTLFVVLRARFWFMLLFAIDEEMPLILADSLDEDTEDADEKEGVINEEEGIL